MRTRDLAWVQHPKWADAEQAMAECLLLVASLHEKVPSECCAVTGSHYTVASQIAPYQWLTSFPQLISRVCHPWRPVFQFICRVIGAVFKACELNRCQSSVRPRCPRHTLSKLSGGWLNCSGLSKRSGASQCFSDSLSTAY